MSSGGILGFDPHFPAWFILFSINSEFKKSKGVLALYRYWAFWIASPVPEASGYFLLLGQDVKLCGLIIHWHGQSSKSTCHFSKSVTCKHAHVCTLACEEYRQQLEMLLAKQSVDPLPRDGEKPVALPVVPREWQSVPNTSISSAAS